MRGTASSSCTRRCCAPGCGVTKSWRRPTWTISFRMCSSPSRKRCPRSRRTAGPAPFGPGCGRSWSTGCGISGAWRDHRPVAVGGSDFLEQIEQLGDQRSQISKLWDSEHDRHVMSRLLELAKGKFAPVTWQAFKRQALDGAAPEAVAAELALPLHSVYAAKSRVLKALRLMAGGLITVGWVERSEAHHNDAVVEGLRWASTSFDPPYKVFSFLCQESVPRALLMCCPSPPPRVV